MTRDWTQGDRIEGGGIQGDRAEGSLPGERFCSGAPPPGLRDCRDLMAFPFFSLAKGRRTAPLIYRRGGVIVRVEAVPEYGMATIWDADVLIWAASLIVDARNRAVPVSPRLGFMPHRFLRFAGRSTGRLGYERLRAALDRLQSTTVRTSLRHAPAGDRGTERLHRFSWIDEWTETVGANGRSRGMEIVLADWFYRGVLDERWVLSIDPAYFALSGGIERWLYRLVRKHGGRGAAGWGFGFRTLHEKSGSLSRFPVFAAELRRIVRRQSLPGYELRLETGPGGAAVLAFRRQR